MKEKKNGWLPIVGGIALIIVLFIGVKLIFAGLNAAVPPERLNPDLAAGGSQGAQASQSLQADQGGQAAQSAQEAQGPRFCPFCGEGLPEGFRWGQFCPYCGEQIQA